MEKITNYELRLPAGRQELQITNYELPIKNKNMNSPSTTLKDRI